MPTNIYTITYMVQAEMGGKKLGFLCQFQFKTTMIHKHTEQMNTVSTKYTTYTHLSAAKTLAST